GAAAEGGAVMEARSTGGKTSPEGRPAKRAPRRLPPLGRRLGAPLALLSLMSAALVAMAGLPAQALASHNYQQRVSFGPAGGNGAFDAGFRHVSDDGTRRLFETLEPLVATD